MSEITYGVFYSSLGNIVLVARNGYIISLSVTRQSDIVVLHGLRTAYPDGVQSDRSFRKTLLQLNRYLKGERTEFEADVDISHLPDFTRAVLDEVRRIPFGETRSYAWVARTLGKGSASRAVGQAVKKNPVPIIIPCHRVVRQDGSIGGFSMENVSKDYLLRLEGGQR